MARQAMERFPAPDAPVSPRPPIGAVTSTVAHMANEGSGRDRWEQAYDAAVEAGRIRDADFTTLSGDDVAPVYGPPDGSEPVAQIGWPGQFPYTRGLYPSGYRGRLWTIRQFAGLRQRGADQRPVPRHPVRRRRRALRGVRHADPDGP